MTLPTLKTDVDYIVRALPATFYRARIRNVFNNAGITTIGDMYEKNYCKEEVHHRNYGLTHYRHFAGKCWHVLNETLTSLGLPVLEQSFAVIDLQSLDVGQLTVGSPKKTTPASFTDELENLLRKHGRKRDFETLTVILLITRLS